jgi:hypothetical protein
MPTSSLCASRGKQLLLLGALAERSAFEAKHALNVIAARKVSSRWSGNISAEPNSRKILRNTERNNRYYATNLQSRKLLHLLCQSLDVRGRVGLGSFRLRETGLGMRVDS